MTCDNCGASCNGAVCCDCERERGAEKVHGGVDVVPLYRREDDDGDWVQKQEGLDGSPEGQATLNRDLVTDGEDA